GAVTADGRGDAGLDLLERSERQAVVAAIVACQTVGHRRQRAGEGADAHGATRNPAPILNEASARSGEKLLRHGALAAPERISDAERGEIEGHSVTADCRSSS